MVHFRIRNLNLYIHLHICVHLHLTCTHIHTYTRTNQPTRTTKQNKPNPSHHFYPELTRSPLYQPPYPSSYTQTKAHLTFRRRHRPKKTQTPAPRFSDRCAQPRSPAAETREPARGPNHSAERPQSRSARRGGGPSAALCRCVWSMR